MIEYENMQPHQKKFYDTVKEILEMGITPTPRVVNEALGKPVRQSWNGPLCQIRTSLLREYGYELVEIQRLGYSNTYRWKKVK